MSRLIAVRREIVRGAKGEKGDRGPRGFPGSGGGDSAIPWLEGVPVTIFGDSYTRYAPPENTPGHRLAKRHRMQEPINNGVSGTRCSEIYQQIEKLWAPNLRSMVVIGSATINNVRVLPQTTLGYTTGAEAFRACLAYLSSRDVRSASDSGSPFRFGPGWAFATLLDGMLSDGTAGRYVDVAWEGDAALDIFVWCTTGAGGTLQAKNAAGTVLASMATGGFSEDFTGVLSVPSQGTGTHTVRLVVSTGAVTIRRASARAATPPLIVWDKPGPILLGLVPTSALRAANVVMQAVADDFDNVVTSDNDTADWDNSTMLLSDTAHRNDSGNAFATDTMQDALSAAVTDYQQGLNTVTDITAAPDYVVPAASYQGSGAAVPDAPVLTGVAASQVRLSWTKPIDNGATLTGYTVQVRTTAGPGSWSVQATLTDPSVLTLLIDAGLTPGTSYDFRIKATNPVGDSAFSNIVTAVAGAVPTAYSSDTFNRAGNPLTLGNADTGQTWAYFNSVFALDTNHAKLTGKTTATSWAHATLSDGQKDGYVKARVLDHAGSAAGVIMCCNSATSPTLAVAVVSYIPSGQYALMFLIAANNWVVRALYNIVPQPNDVVGIYKNGNVYTAVINGVGQAPESAGLADLTSTRHGLISFASGAVFDEYTHQNINPLV